MQGSVKDERGNVSIIAVFLATTLAGLLVLGVSFGSLYARWSVVSNTLDVARDTTCTAGFQMMVKESKTPGKLIAARLAEELKRAGVEGKLTVWFAESGDSSLGKNVRAMAYSAKFVCSTCTDTLLGTIELPCLTSASIVPYGSQRTYDPGLRGTAYMYVYSSLNSKVRVTKISMSALPARATKALAKAVNKASEYQIS